jgi:hypothetical protein
VSLSQPTAVQVSALGSQDVRTAFSNLSSPALQVLCCLAPGSTRMVRVISRHAPRPLLVCHGRCPVLVAAMPLAACFSCQSMCAKACGGCYPRVLRCTRRFEVIAVQRLLEANNAST